MAARQRTLFLLVYISIPAVTAAKVFSLTAGHFAVQR